MKENSEKIRSKCFYLVLGCAAAFVVFHAAKPAVFSLCRFILKEDSSLSEEDRSRVVGVETQKVVVGTTQKQVKSIGILKGRAEVCIKAEIPGKIKEIKFVEGAEVEKDQDLVVFEDENYVANKERAEAEYVLALKALERSKKLCAGNAGVRKTFEEDQAKMTAAKAQLDSASYDLSKTRIRAPFSGTIGIMKESVGNMVQQHAELVTVVDNTTMQVEFMVPAKNINDLAVGQFVDVYVDAFPGKVFSGVVDAIDSAVEIKSNSVLVRAAIPNKEKSLRHGMYATVNLVTGEKSDAILVNEDALDRDGATEYVWIVDEKGRAYKRRVLTGAKGETGVEVLAGIHAGEVVVTAGQLKLSEGVLVKPLNQQEVENEETETEETQEEVVGE